MAEVIMVKTQQGHFVPANEEEAEKLKKIKAGVFVRCEVKQIRNYKFLQKYMVLVKYAFDIWEEGAKRLRYKGNEVKPNIERFRKDLQILAGFYEPVYHYDGTLKLESKSVSFAEMSEEEFEKVYSALIDVILAKILNRPDLNQEIVRRHVDQLMQFDR